MSLRDQPTPPFNSPYQQAIKSTALLHSPAYPSPTRSDTEPAKYPSTDSLGLYNYQQSFPASGPPASSVLYPPSPQPTEAWSHYPPGTSPLIHNEMGDPWSSGAFDHPVARSPIPGWAPQHASQRSSLSSTREMSIFSRESSEHAFPSIKLEGNHEWTTDDDSSPGLQQGPLTVAPDRLTTSIFPYDNPYPPPALPKFESTPAPIYDHADFEQLSFEDRARSPPQRSGSDGITARTRQRRNPTTPANAAHKCEICNKLFQRNYNYKTHLETHNPSRKKEHLCPYSDCERQFVRKTDLDRHQNSVHRKLKVYKCLKCDAHFARKDTLRRHEEDGCPKRNEVATPNMLSRSRSMRTAPGPAMPYYPSPRPDLYHSRTPPMFRDDSFPGSPAAF